MKLTDPALVGLLFDTGHSTIAGEDPVEILKKYIGRVAHIHVKDVRSEVFEQVKSGGHSFLWGVKNGMFTVPGDGDCVDWMSIFEILKASDYEAGSLWRPSRIPLRLIRWSTPRKRARSCASSSAYN